MDLSGYLVSGKDSNVVNTCVLPEHDPEHHPSGNLRERGCSENQSEDRDRYGNDHHDRSEGTIIFLFFGFDVDESAIFRAYRV